MRFFTMALFSLALLASCSKEKIEPHIEPKPRAQPLLAGVVEIDASVKSQADPLAVLFIIARNEKGQIAAVKKLFPPFQYPVAFSLTSEDAMIAGTSLDGPLQVSARLDKDGSANPAQPGDIVGRATSSHPPSSIRILLNDLVK